jgi:hypothetical protein
MVAIACTIGSMSSARAPRALVASPSLLRALSACASTTVTGVRGARRASPTLSLVALEKLEEELGFRLHDDLLVLLALRDPIVKLFTGIGDLNDLGDASENEAPEGYVCISTVYSDPVGERMADAHGGPYLYLVVPREPEGLEARILVYEDGIDVEPPSDDAGVTIESLMDDLIHAARSGEWGEHVTTGPGREVPLDPVPKLVAGRRLQTARGGGEKVTHPKFGEGTVVRRVGEGDQEKVVVRFADAERTLLARFLRH